jgi:hypothetical protein
MEYIIGPYYLCDAQKSVDQITTTLRCCWLPAYVSIMYRADGGETMVRNAESKKYVTYSTDEIKEEEYTTKLLLLLFLFFLFSLCSVVEIPS